MSLLQSKWGYEISIERDFLLGYLTFCIVYLSLFNYFFLIHFQMTAVTKKQFLVNTSEDTLLRSCRSFNIEE